MEASAKTGQLSGEKALRIVAAMRASVGKRGWVGSTFDNVAREAGVSRGLLHYYFGSKERLMIEVIRQDTDIRLSMVDAGLGAATSNDDIVALLVSNLRDVIEHEPVTFTLGFELIGEASRNPEIGAEMSALNRRTQQRISEILERKQTEGVINMVNSPQVTAALLLAIGQGLAMEVIGDPDADHDPVIEAAARMAGSLLGGG